MLIFEELIKCGKIFNYDFYDNYFGILDAIYDLIYSIVKSKVFQELEACHL